MEQKQILGREHFVRHMTNPADDKWTNENEGKTGGEITATGQG